VPNHNGQAAKLRNDKGTGFDHRSNDQVGTAGGGDKDVVEDGELR
jgi:hypothetical protein